MSIKHISILFALFIFTFSCEEFTTDPVLVLGAAPSFSTPSSGTEFLLEEAKAAETLTTFTWAPADFGYQAGITYTVQVDKAGNSFGSAVTLGVANTNSLAVTHDKLNAIILGMGVEEALATDLELRIIAEVSDEVDQLISAPLALTATPYIVEIVVPQLQVPGSYQGWDPANNSTIIFSPRSDGKFEGFLFFSAENTMYKFTDGPSWDVNWGDDGTDGTLDPGGMDIPASEGIGLYRLNADVNALTHTAVRTDWGVIGDATPTGWGADTDMVYDDATGTLSLTLDLGAGFIKFRANDGWDINFGDNDTNGSLEYGGADIPIDDPGNYTIELILNQPRYTYKLTKN